MPTIHTHHNKKTANPVGYLPYRIFSCLPIVGVHREPGNVCIQKRGGNKRFTNATLTSRTLVR